VDDYEVLDIERDGNVATVWLNRPEARNAMGPAFWRELPIVMAELGSDPWTRAIVIAARGPHFSVGLDLKAFGQSFSGAAGNGAGKGARNEAGKGAGSGSSPAVRAWEARAEVLRMQASITSVADCPKPIIAAVHGYCIGGGVDLISACDIRLASANASFSVRETRVAIVADLGSLQRLPRLVGRGQVAELAFTGRDISAERAMAIGLVNDVYPDSDALHSAGQELAGEIASKSPLVVQGVKAVLAASEGRSVKEGLDYVATWNAAFLQSEDLTEAMTAFMEKRTPRFTGR